MALWTSDKFHGALSEVYGVAQRSTSMGTRRSRSNTAKVTCLTQSSQNQTAQSPQSQRNPYVLLRILPTIFCLPRRPMHVVTAKAAHANTTQLVSYGTLQSGPDDCKGKAISPVSAETQTTIIKSEKINPPAPLTMRGTGDRKSVV